MEKPGPTSFQRIQKATVEHKPNPTNEKKRTRFLDTSKPQQTKKLKTGTIGFYIPSGLVPLLSSAEIQKALEAR